MKSGDNKTPHRIGWVRVSPYYPAKPQIEAVQPRVAALYSSANGETIADVLQAVRKGNEVYVHGLDRLGETRAEVVAVLEALRNVGASVYDVEIGTPVSIDCIEAAAVMIGRLAGERRMPSSEIARKRGALGGRARAKPKLKKADALKVWKDATLSVEVAAHRIGMHWRSCYRQLGGRGLPAGRKRK